MGILCAVNGCGVMTVSSSAFFNVISNSKDIDQFTQGDIDKDYKPYVVNRMVAQYKTLIFFADEMNISYRISKEHQLIFYNSIIPKSKRRVLWSAKKKDYQLEIVMKYYHISQEKADIYLRILSDAQITELEERLNTGGRE